MSAHEKYRKLQLKIGVAEKVGWFYFLF